MNETAIVCTSANRYGETFACPLTKNGPLNAAARRPRPPLEPDRCDKRGKARPSRAREASRRCIEPIRPRQASVIRARLGGWKQGEPRARRRDGRRHTGAACRPESHTARDGRMRLSIAEIERAQALSRRDAACRTTGSCAAATSRRTAGTMRRAIRWEGSRNRHVMESGRRGTSLSLSLSLSLSPVERQAASGKRQAVRQDRAGSTVRDASVNTWNRSRRREPGSRWLHERSDARVELRHSGGDDTRIAASHSGRGRAKV
ncbi:putative hIT domain protein [Burkholderia pseudomallei MSHR983]|nr:putative hIT domain protein [Burkholderia pseudomallei MSHR983]